MNKATILLILIIGLTGCAEQTKSASQTDEFKWASVDFNKIESEVYMLAKEENATIWQSTDYKHIEYERDRIRIAQKKLMLDLCGVKIFNPPARPYEARNDVEREALVHEKLSQERCEYAVKSHPDFRKLRQEMDALDDLKASKSDYKTELRKFAKAYANSLVETYSKGKFEVVIDQNRDALIYNSAGISVDITDAVMGIIDPEALQFPDISED